MKIHKLEIRGFKSFPDKTVLEFRPGITSVVGPNGCGKSNILEAIRWAMGEQRVRSLRSKKMEDVIFNGSESRKPVGMAEVRLVLSNHDGCGPQSMSDYPEIMITRRLFRDGESNYEINNVPCRLSDITDFFLDTGVGKNSYAIIEQGRVDQIVASKPEDRRVLIEEAAGISRYKSRKEAALKKLEMTRQNLQRIADVVAEVKRQGTSLKRQASRAERYRQLSERLRTADIGLHAYKCRELERQVASLKAKLDADRAELVRNESQLALISANLEKDRLAALEAEKELKQLREAHHRVDIQLTSVRGLTQTNRTRSEQLVERTKRVEQDQSSIQEKIHQAEALRKEVEEREISIRVDLKAVADELVRAASEAQEAERTLQSRRTEMDRLKDDIFRGLQEAAQARNQRESLTRRAAEIDRSLQKHEDETAEAAAMREKEQAERTSLATRAAQIAEQRKAALLRKEELSGKVRDTRQRISSLRADLADKEKALAGNRGRLVSLMEIQTSYRSYNDGVRYLMQNREDSLAQDLLGPLGEIIDVPPEYQKAVAAALGERLGHLVVTAPREGVKGAELLQQAEAGRSTFIPLQPRSQRSATSGGLPEGLPRLRDLVRFREGFEELGDFLLDRCFLVEDVRHGLQLWERNGIEVDLVTPQGELITRHGEVTGGTVARNNEELFERRREIEELERRVSATEATCRELQTSLTREEANLEELTALLQKTDQELQDLNVQEVRIKKDLERADAQIAVADRRLEVLRLERERLVREKNSQADELRKLEETVSRLEATRSEQEQRRQALSLGMEEMLQASQQKAQQASEIKIRTAQLEERSKSIHKEFQSALENLKNLESRLAELADEMSRNAAEEQRLVQEAAHLASQEKELMEEARVQRGRIDELEHEAAELSARVKSSDQEATALSGRVKGMRETVHSLEMESARIDQALQALMDKIADRYQVDVREVPVPETPPAEDEIKELRANLEAMGEVNLAAISESRQIEERLKFLVEQEDDLKKAVDSLYTTINAINKTTRERFREAFDSVNEKFREIFPFLFGGGEARLDLTDEEDLLETGVDIMARPPGKRIQNMDLLSGGEKALTAVALIFSIFLIRPSPFCLLDEVDAPLDDANINRFNEMIRRLSDQTQFLVITHNKRTMEHADCLYGVTMEEPGSSGVVSVEFLN